MVSSAVEWPRTKSWLSRHRITIVALVSFLLMAFTVMEQGRTIDNQRALIRSLWDDSVALTALRVHVITDRQRHEQKKPPAGAVPPELSKPN